MKIKTWQAQRAVMIGNKIIQSGERVKVIDKKVEELTGCEQFIIEVNGKAIEVYYTFFIKYFYVIG